MMNTQPITSIVPTYNGSHLLNKYLPALLQSMDNGDCLIISDDASTDATVSDLTKMFDLQKVSVESAAQSTIYEGYFKTKSKKIKIILQVHTNNLRFAESVNRAVNLCTTPYFFLVNNDVQVQKDTLSILRRAIQQDENIFAIGCLEYEDTQSGIKSGKNKLWFEKGLFRHSKADDFDSGATAWASGGSAMFSTPKWKELGGFDTDYYPAYWEDTDLSFRAKKRGWKVLFNKDAVVIHKHESTNSGEFGQKALEKISWKNAFTFTWKHATFLQKLEYFFWYPYWQWQRMK